MDGVAGACEGTGGGPMLPPRRVGGLAAQPARPALDRLRIGGGWPVLAAPMTTDGAPGLNRAQRCGVGSRVSMRVRRDTARRPPAGPTLVVPFAPQRAPSPLRPRAPVGFCPLCGRL